ncbi:MAG: ABC transporter substrate-binding protein, partial [Chloroflexota bacterium]
MKNVVPFSRKWFGVLMILVLLGASLGGCSSEKVIKIGFATEQTGVESYIGQAAVPALQDHIDKINAEGGIGGYKLQLVVYDTRSEVTDAVAVAKRLIDQDKVVGVIGPSWSAAAIPMAEIADAGKVPVIGTTASNVNVTVDEAGNLHPYMFRVCFIDPYQGFALAEFAYKELGKRNVAFLTDRASPYSVGIEKFFTEQFTKLGGAVVASEGYQTGDTEFRAQLAKIKDSSADLLMMPAYTYRDPGLAAQQGKALGLEMTMMGADGWFVDDLLPMAGKELEGAFLTTGVSTESPEFAAYNKEFEAKHKVKPNIYQYYSLDALMAIEWALRQVVAKGQEPTGTAVRDALETMTDVQLFTSKVTMEPDTHNPHNKPILIMTIKDSAWS